MNTITRLSVMPAVVFTAVVVITVIAAFTTGDHAAIIEAGRRRP